MTDSAPAKAMSRKNYRSLETKITALLGDVGIPRPWSVESFCERLGEFRGRPIELLPVDMPGGGPDGVWIALPSVDVIVFDRRTSDLHREHIICHELGHVLLCHRGDTGAEVVVPDLEAQLIRAMRRASEDSPADATDTGDGGPRMYRQNYDSRQEQEAELAAHLVWKLGGRRFVATPRGLTGDEAGVVDRLAEVMGRVPRG